MQQHGSKYFAKRPLFPDHHGCGQKVKNQLFQEMVMLLIKLKGMTKAAVCTHMFCPCTHPRLRDQKVKFFFSESGHVTYKVNGNGE